MSDESSKNWYKSLLKLIKERNDYLDKKERNVTINTNKNEVFEYSLDKKKRNVTVNTNKNKVFEYTLDHNDRRQRDNRNKKNEEPSLLDDDEIDFKGKGIMDVLKDPIGTIKEGLYEIPTKLNNISTNTLKELGTKNIKALTIIRSPLKKHWENALNVLSLGKFKEIQKKLGYDKLFHLSLLADVEDKIIIIEKNEVIHIAPIDKEAIDKNTEYLNVSLNNKLTLDVLIDNTLKGMGSTEFYDYDALGVNGKQPNNCQNFIMQILNYNKILTQKEKNFIYQDMTPITEELKNQGVGFVPNMLKFITNTGSRVSRFIGKGKKGKKKESIYDFILNNKFRFL